RIALQDQPCPPPVGCSFRRPAGLRPGRTFFAIAAFSASGRCWPKGRRIAYRRQLHEQLLLTRSSRASELRATVIRASVNKKNALIGRIYLRSPFLFLKAQNRSCMQGEDLPLRLDWRWIRTSGA